MGGTKAKPVLRHKVIYADGWIVQAMLWQVPPSEQGFKYRLYAGQDGQRIVGLDNERGKGDHMHLPDSEAEYEWRQTEAPPNVGNTGHRFLFVAHSLAPCQAPSAAPT